MTLDPQCIRSVPGRPSSTSLPLQAHGLQWIHSPAVLAHPLDDGTAITLERDLANAKTSLGVDGDAWARLVQPFVEQWTDFALEVLPPNPSLPKHPWLIAHFGIDALLSAKTIAPTLSRSERARALFAESRGALISWSRCIVEWCVWHVDDGVGTRGRLADSPWRRPVHPTTALCRCLATLDGKVRTSSRIDSLAALSSYDLILCDVTPRQLLRIAGPRLSDSYKRRLEHFRYGAGVFKVDYAPGCTYPVESTPMLARCNRTLRWHF